MIKKWKWTGLGLFFVVFTASVAFFYATRVQEVQGYSEIAHDMYTVECLKDFSQEDDADVTVCDEFPYHFLSNYSVEIYEIVRPAVRTNAREWYAAMRQLHEYLEQYGDPYLHICESKQYLIDIDGYFYMSTFNFYFCDDENRFFFLD